MTEESARHPKKSGARRRHNRVFDTSYSTNKCLKAKSVTQALTLAIGRFYRTS
jgi:hypothetical protein